MNGLCAAVGYGKLWLFITLNRNQGALKSMNNECNMKPIETCTPSTESRESSV